ncbi:MAG: anti-sigma factor [Pseudomonadota bacterium]
MILEEEKLSAFLDGELPDAEVREIEEALRSDRHLQAELERLMAADTAARSAFKAIAAEPVPLALAAAIQKASTGEDVSGSMAGVVPSRIAQGAPTSQRGGGLSRLAIAASVALAGLVSGVGGYVFGSGWWPAQQEEQVAAAPGWLAQVAEYHAVYAAQGRHLVEVGADEADHIQNWLTDTLGAQVLVPDLSDHGLTFQGARLVVAAGRPVAQLMYTDADGAVVALCQIQSAAPNENLVERTVGGFEMAWWGGTDSNFVLVADEGHDGLQDLAQAVSQQI